MKKKVKSKRKKVANSITVRLQFEDQLKIDFEDFRFVMRQKSSKAAALLLIETGLMEWKKKQAASQKLAPTIINPLSDNENESPL